MLLYDRHRAKRPVHRADHRHQYGTGLRQSFRFVPYLEEAHEDDKSSGYRFALRARFQSPSVGNHAGLGIGVDYRLQAAARGNFFLLCHNEECQRRRRVRRKRYWCLEDYCGPISRRTGDFVGTLRSRTLSREWLGKVCLSGCGGNGN